MKKLIAFLTIFILLFTLPFSLSAWADESQEGPDSGYQDPGMDPDGEDPIANEPEIPEIPEDPDDPEDPEEPEDPEIPEDPEEPEDPVLPEDPDLPALPPSLTIKEPTKKIYYINEKPDYTGGYLIYTDGAPLQFTLDGYCTWPDMTTPGNKTVLVQVGSLQESFNIVVLDIKEPILNMTDIFREHWSYQYFGPCMKAGYFTGDDVNHLNPNNPITRAEMAQIIYRAWQNDPKVMVEKTEGIAAPFKDVSPESWYFEAIDACRKAGIIRGMDANNCEPNRPISRQDAVLMLMRIRYTDEEMLAVDLDGRMNETGIHPVDFDTVSSYATGAMALALGDIIFGDDTNAVNPHKSITRAESAAIFHRLFLKDVEWEAPPEFEIENAEEFEMPLIYLSPSNQFTNPYAIKTYNEGDEMYKVGEAVKQILLDRGYRVYMARRDSSINDRPNQANRMGADLYIPIHSNAGGKQTGTYVFYNGAIQGCEEFSREIFDRLAALTGTAYSTSRHKEDYLCLLPDGAPFKEVMNPTMPLAFIEVEFHDKQDKAQWIVSHTQEIAKAIAEGIIAYSEKNLIKDA